MDNEPVINYTAKELLERMDGKLDGLGEQLTGVIGRVDSLEAKNAAKAAFWSMFRNWLIGAATVAASVAAIVGVTLK